MVVNRNRAGLYQVSNRNTGATIFDQVVRSKDIGAANVIPTQGCEFSENAKSGER